MLDPLRLSAHGQDALLTALEGLPWDVDNPAPLCERLHLILGVLDHLARHTLDPADRLTFAGWVAPERRILVATELCHFVDERRKNPGKGFRVLLTVGGREIPAVIALRSDNGRSLALAFDATVELPATAAVGMLPIYQNDDGTWIEILTGAPVALRFR